jgi:hypothetical protein
VAGASPVGAGSAAVALAPEPDALAESAPPAEPTPSPEPAASPDRAGASDPVSGLEAIKQSWPAVVETVRTHNAFVAAVVADAQPVAVDARELTIAFPPEAGFLCRKAQETANRQLVADAVQTVTGRGLGLSYELREDLEATSGQAVSEEEWVARFMAEFDAEELEGGSDHSSSESEEA